MAQRGGVTGFALDELCDLGAGWRIDYGQQVVIGQALLDVPAVEDRRAGVPRVVVQIAILVGGHDVVDPYRPGAPLVLGLVGAAVVGIEQPPATHVGLCAVGEAMCWYGVRPACWMIRAAIAGRASSLASKRQKRLSM